MNRDKKIFLCVGFPLLVFLGFIMVNFYMILTVFAGVILAALIGGTLRRDRMWKRLTRLSVIFFMVFVILFPNVTRWPEQIARRLPGGRQELLEPTYSGFPALNASFHEYYLWKNKIPFESAPDFENETRSIDEYIRRNRTEYTFDYTNPLYLLNDALPTVDDVFHSDYDEDGTWNDDCDGMTVVTASFLIYLGYNAFISETYFHWQTIVFPDGADPRTVAGYNQGIVLYRINPDELKLSFYLFNQTEMFIAPTLTVWDGIRDNIFDSWIVDSIFGDTGLEPWVWAIAIPIVAIVLCLLFAVLLRVFFWKLRSGARVYKVSAKGAIIMSAVLYVLLLLYLNNLSQFGNVVLFSGIGVTLAFIDPRLHGNGREKEPVKASSIPMPEVIPKEEAIQAPISPMAPPLEKDQLQKLEQLISVSDRVKIDDMAAILKMPRTDLLNKLLELTDKFHFRIQGEEIVFETGSSTSDFIAQLERDFKAWSGSGTKKD